MEKELLREIKQFLRETGMGPSYFGQVATGNSSLVSRLERGRTVTLRTVENVRAYMLVHRRRKAA